MTESTPRERLQPSLLDRLTDEHPEKKQESRDKRVLTVQRLREVVLRDLAWLLNTSSLDATDDLTNYPFVAESVLNYGTPDLTGITASSLVTEQLERMVKKALLRFEPRILSGSVKISAQPVTETSEQNTVALEIDAQVWGQPLPQQLFLRTEIDLETGDVNIRESPGRSSD